MMFNKSSEPQQAGKCGVSECKDQNGAHKSSLFFLQRSPSIFHSPGTQNFFRFWGPVVAANEHLSTLPHSHGNNGTSPVSQSTWLTGGGVSSTQERRNLEEPECLVLPRLLHIYFKSKDHGNRNEKQKGRCGLGAPHPSGRWGLGAPHPTKH